MSGKEPYLEQEKFKIKKAPVLESRDLFFVVFDNLLTLFAHRLNKPTILTNQKLCKQQMISFFGDLLANKSQLCDKKIKKKKDGNYPAIGLLD